MILSARVRHHPKGRRPKGNIIKTETPPIYGGVCSIIAFPIKILDM